MKLIDADKIGLTDFEIVMCNGDYKKALKMLLDKISNQPTAYDIDKVVDELEKASKDVSRGYLGKDNNKYHKHYKAVKLSRAIEIVKHGCVSDDVCKWKYNDTEYYWESSCEHLHIFMADGPKENEYSFCPYCGKKIKVVE